MDELTRRRLVQAGIGSFVGMAGSVRRAFGQLSFLRYPFSLGVASGEPEPDGVVLWTRIAPDPLHGGGMPNADFPVRWELAVDPGMRRIIRSGETLARPELAHSVHVELAGLQPATDYWYRFEIAGETSPVGRTKTAPPAGAPVASLRFGVAGCQNYESGFFTAFRHLADENFDFVFHYGDYIYEHRLVRPEAGARQPPRLFPEPTDELYSLDDYRNRYAGYKIDPELQAAHASAPWLVSFDDHEVDNNWVSDIDQDGTPPAIFSLRRAAAFQAYYEHMPLRMSSLPGPHGMTMHRRFGFGDLAQIHVLDTRQYRSDQPCGDGIVPGCADALTRDRTMLGEAQERWLRRGLLRSDARWNVLAQQVVMMQQDRAAAEDVVATSMDKWDGAVAARERLFATLKRRRVANPVVLSGDIHNNWAGELWTDFDDERSATVAHEFVVTSATSGGDGSDQLPDTPAILAQNPHIRFFNNQRGYLAVDLTPAELTAHFRVVDFVSRPGAARATRASFVIEADRPGLHRL